jgi:hypothetical protein
MNYHRQPARLTVAIVLSLTVLFSVAKLSKATGTITKADLTGPWAMTLTGDTGCGISTSYVTFTLNSAGSGSATITSHTSGCGDHTSTGDAFTINTLNANGSGTANLSCGPGCGWNLNIQVAPDRSIFNVVDVSPANPGNYLEGLAVHE